MKKPSLTTRFLDAVVADCTACRGQGVALSAYRKQAIYLWVHVINASFAEYLALNLDVISDILHLSCNLCVPTPKQVSGEGAGTVSDCPAGHSRL